MIKEVHQALGSWEVRLRRDTPRYLLDAITPFGHIIIVPERIDPREFVDEVLETMTRYAGVYRGRSDDEDAYTLTGAGLALWLGDEDGKGDIINNVVAASASFPDAVRSVLPPGGSITEGTLHSVPGYLNHAFKWTTPREALTYITDTFSTDSEPVSWRIDSLCRLSAGRDSDLFVTQPRAMLVRGSTGRDLELSALPGSMSLSRDVEDYTTQVVLLAEGEGNATITASASSGTVPYKDMNGNTVRMTRLVSESTTNADNAQARAQLQLNRFTSPRYDVDLSSDDYDIKGEFVVGDRVYVYDPESGFMDADVFVEWDGDLINPIALKVTEMVWPVPDGWTVAFRDYNGAWWDLSEWYIPESGATRIGVGDLRRDLAGLGSEPVGTRPHGDTSSPAVPSFVVPFETVAYQSDAANDVRAAVRVMWNEPFNVDGSTVLDGHHYEIRYRTTQTFSYPITWLQAGTFTWDELQTWGRPLSNPAAVSGAWIVAYAGWDENELIVPELTVAAEYEFQIRAVDSATPPNQSVWSASTFVTTRGDLIAPSSPAPPAVASSPVSIQIVHTLGRSTGGTYNLEADLDHLEVHVGGPTFFPDSATLVGKVVANAGMLAGRIPAVATFTIGNTSDVWVKVVAVDRFGNKSDPSGAVQATVQLIDSEHISDLTASKITAGTITSSLILGGEIATGTTGARARMSAEGFQTYDSDGDLSISLTGDPEGTDNYLNIVNNGQTLASIDNEGKGSFTELNISGESTFQGKTLTALLNERPRGIVAMGMITSAPPVYTTTAELGLFEVSFVAEANRSYVLYLSANAGSSVAGDQITFNIRDGGSSDPTVTSTQVGRASHAVQRAGFGESWFDARPYFPSAGLHRLLLCMAREPGGGSGTVNLSINSSQPAAIWVEDKGSLISNLAVLNTGLTTGGVLTPPSPVTTYQKDYYAIWSGTYDNSGKLIGYHGNECHQGSYGGTNRRSMIGFDWQTIRNDLSGATVNNCWITLTYYHWWYNNGGTAVIGTHVNGGGRPGSFVNVNTNRVQSGGWPRGGTRTVSLGAVIGTEFRNVQSTGVVLGPGPGGDPNQYYGKAYGAGSSSAPRLTINYTK